MLLSDAASRHVYTSLSKAPSDDPPALHGHWRVGAGCSSMSAPGQRAELSVRGQRPASRLVQQGIGTPGERGAGSGASMADPAAAPPALVRKVRRVLEIKETGERVEALRVFGDVSLASDPAGRRDLRSEVLQARLAQYQRLLSEVGRVASAVEAVAEDADALAGSCATVRASLEASRASTQDLLMETSRLRAQAQRAEAREARVRDFLAHYQLRDEQVAAVREGPIGDAFFAALEAVDRAQAKCRALVAERGEGAGLELVEAVASHHEVALERLCTWVVDAWGGTGEQTTPPDPDPTLLRRASATLHARPPLFRHAMHAGCAQRGRAMFRAFARALTEGPRALEMRAGDPVRYVSDMLAWVHQATAQEKELLECLYPNEGAETGEGDGQGSNEGGGAVKGAVGGNGTNGAVRASSSVSLSPSPTEALNAVMEALSEPLSARIRRVLASPDASPILTLRLMQVLAFYCQTLAAVTGVNTTEERSKEVGAESGSGSDDSGGEGEGGGERGDGAGRASGVLSPSLRLADAVRGCRDRARARLVEGLAREGRGVEERPPPLPPIAAPAAPTAVVEAAGVVEAMCREWRGSVGEGDAWVGEAMSDALGGYLQPLMRVCATLGDALAARVTQGSHPHPTSRPPPPLPNTPNTPTLAPTSVPENAPPAAQAVAEGQALSARGALLVNCAVPLRQALRQAGCLKRWEGEVAAMEERGGAEAVEGEVGVLLGSCGVADVEGRMRAFESEGQRAAMASDPALRGARVAGCLRALFQRAAMPGALPEMERVTDAVMRSHLSRRALSRLVDSYAYVWHCLSDTGCGYDPSDVAGAEATPGEFATVVGVERGGVEI